MLSQSVKNAFFGYFKPPACSGEALTTCFSQSPWPWSVPLLLSPNLKSSPNQSHILCNLYHTWLNRPHCSHCVLSFRRTLFCLNLFLDLKWSSGVCWKVMKCRGWKFCSICPGFSTQILFLLLDLIKTPVWISTHFHSIPSVFLLH